MSIREPVGFLEPPNSVQDWIRNETRQAQQFRLSGGAKLSTGTTRRPWVAIQLRPSTSAWQKSMVHGDSATVLKEKAKP